MNFGLPWEWPTFVFLGAIVIWFGGAIWWGGRPWFRRSESTKDKRR